MKDFLTEVLLPFALGFVFIPAIGLTFKAIYELFMFGWNLI